MTDDTNKSKSKSSSSNTLSRSSLYTSMAAYNQTRVPPSTYMQQSRSLPTSNLIDFLTKVSSTHHYGSKTTMQKNTSCRPRSTQEMSDRLSQRGLTLVGGGINSTKLSTSSTSTANKKRKNKHKHSNKTSSSSSKQDFVFIQALNLQWNDYARKVLLADKDKHKDNTKKTVHIDEWVGAKARVATCASHPNYVGKEGILVADTLHTWRLHVCVQTQDDDDQQKQKTQWLIIPKKKSSLVILLDDLCISICITK
jgi:RNase P/RNase MRP subunit p29